MSNTITGSNTTFNSKIGKQVFNVHISTITAGDIILCLDGRERTVNKEFIKKGFMGVTLFGDSYRLGTLPVQKVVYKLAV